MSGIWTLCTLGSKGQRSRSQCKDYWKWFQAHNCFSFTPILMKLHMQSPHESRMGPMDFGVKRLEVKVTMQVLLKNGFWLITASALHWSSWNFTCSLPMSRIWTICTLGSKVKGQGHNARTTENGFKRITASPLHRSSWNFTCSLPMSRIWTLLTLGSKGQRSRSQCKDYWKWFQAHNCFPFTPILMKLHMQSPHESNMGPMDFGVKGQRSRSQCKYYWKWFLAHNCFPFLAHNLGSLNGCRGGYFVPLGQPHSS